MRAAPELLRPRSCLLRGPRSAWLKSKTDALFARRSYLDSPKSVNVFQYRGTLMLSPLRNMRVITTESSWRVVTSFMSSFVNETTSLTSGHFSPVIQFMFDAYLHPSQGSTSCDAPPEMSSIASSTGSCFGARWHVGIITILFIGGGGASAASLNLPKTWLGSSILSSCAPCPCDTRSRGYHMAVSSCIG